MRLPNITPLHLSREWTRLLQSGHPPQEGTAPAFSQIRPQHRRRNLKCVWTRHSVGALITNPVVQSEPPIPKRHQGSALTPAQQKLLFDAATGCWCLSAFLELSAATGARRGEVLALRWADVDDGAVLIGRSLSQTRAGLQFSEHETERVG